MLQTPARLLRLLSMLQARRSWPGSELAERLEVTDRTLRRDVDRLRSLGYPVHSTSGVAGGYSLGAGASLPPLMLDDDEGVAVFVGLEGAASGSVRGIEEASSRALAKLERVMPTRIRRRIKTLGASIVRISQPGPQVELSAVSALAQACSDQLEIAFTYCDQRGASSQRSVEPYRLVHTERRWYLVAWDKQRQDWRTFRVDRVQFPLESGPAFVPRSLPDGDVVAYAVRSVAGHAYAQRASVILSAPLAEAQRVLPAGAGQLEALDDQRCRFRTAGHSLESIAGWLGRLPMDFVVESPPELASHLRALAARLERAAGG
jgi:predicted DNA-binding transcriptional regulator YafY